jgi:hypothetical protein
MKTREPRIPVPAERVRSRAEILAGAVIRRTTSGVEYAWVPCHNCGGSGNYPSSMIPPGRCRLYCWDGRDADTFGRLPLPVEQYVRRAQAEDRAEYRAGVRAAARAEQTARRAADPDLRAAALAAAFGLDLTRLALPPFAGWHCSTAVDLLAAYLHDGALSDAQWALAAGLPGRAAEDVAKRAEEARTVPAPAGRCTVEAELMKVELREGRWGRAYKALFRVRTPAGSWRCWGTAPRGLAAEAPRGTRVRFAATFTPKDGAADFAWYTRPTKVEAI